MGLAIEGIIEGYVWSTIGKLNMSHHRQKPSQSKYFWMNHVQQRPAKYVSFECPMYSKLYKLFQNINVPRTAEYAYLYGLWMYHDPLILDILSMFECTTSYEID